MEKQTYIAKLIIVAFWCVSMNNTIGRFLFKLGRNEGPCCLVSQNRNPFPMPLVVEAFNFSDGAPFK